MLNVLFLCTGNSARSIMAEVLLTHRGAGRFRGFSAGSHPKGIVHPLALEVLNRHQLPTTGLRSKSWDEFGAAGAPELHLVFTVCDQAAQETCPVWPGHPATAHWGIADPAAIAGPDADKRRGFERAFQELDARIARFLALPVETMERAALRDALDGIGRDAGIT